MWMLAEILRKGGKGGSLVQMKHACDNEQTCNFKQTRLIPEARQKQTRLIPEA